MKIKNIIIVVLLFSAVNAGTIAKSKNKNFSLELITNAGYETSLTSSPDLYSEITENNDSENKFKSPIFGGKFKLPFFDFCYYQEKTNINFGMSIGTQNLLDFMELSFKTGNLRYSGGISRLKTPALSSSISPFSAVNTNTTSLSVNLPSYSSFNKPVSFSTEINLLKLKFYINTLFNPDEEIYAFSLNKKFAKQGIQICLNSGNFGYEEHTFQSWFSDIPQYFSLGRHWCTNGQISFSLKNFSSLNTFSLFESPYKNLAVTYRSENKIKTKNLTLNVNGAYIPERIFTASQENISPCLQFKTGGFYKYRIPVSKPLFLKTGINTYTKIDLEKDNNIFNFTTGLQFVSLFSIFTVTANINSEIENNKNEINLNFTNYTLKLQESLSFKKLNPVISLRFSYKPSEEKEKSTFSSNYSIQLNYFNIQKISFITSFSQVFSDIKFTKESFTASLKLNLSRKNIAYSLKFDVDVSYDS